MVLQRLWLRLRIPLLVAVALLLVGGAALARWLGPLPDAGRLPERVAVPSNWILDRHGRLLYEVVDPQAGKHTPVPLARIPLACQQATIATEDANFYRHPGVDITAIARALWQDLRAGAPVAGGSTLTQQLARNLLLPDERTERTLQRKLREAALALQLEWRYGKDELLALYLNQTYYGHFAYGIEAAAQSYFGKQVAELDLAECALLAGLPQWPPYYNPLENPDAAEARQETVLGLMAEAGYISVDEAALAAREPLRFAASPFPIAAPHFVMLAQQMVEQEVAPELWQRGGLRVVTTLDLDWQTVAEEAVQRQLAALAADPQAPLNRRIDNAALVAVDPATGDVLAMVGSPDYFDARTSGAVNGALALRQPGSAIKPVTYAAAFDATQGGQPLTPATLIADVTTTFPTREGTPYVPKNYDLQEHGPVLARQALASSLNVPAVKVLQHIGLPAFIDQAQRLGITTFADSGRFGLSLTLGGGEVSLLELTAAYAAFANGGQRVTPRTLLRIEDANGQTLREWPSQIGPQAVSPQVAYLLTDILSDNDARSLGFGRHSVLRLDRPAAVKTGTTTDWRDNWTVGYTPQLAVGVWVGNADNAPMQGVSGVDGAAPIWHDFVNIVLRNQPHRTFPRPDGLLDVEVCADTGLLPDGLCPTRWETFIAGTEPTETDRTHHRVTLDVTTGRLAVVGTPPERTVQRIARVLPAELHDSARANQVLLLDDLARQSPEVAMGASAPVHGLASSGEPLALTQPASGATYRLSPGLPLSAQRLEVAARPGDGVQFVAVRLLVDGQLLADVSAPPYRAWWNLTPGEHEFTAIGVTRDGREVTSASTRITVEGSAVASSLSFDVSHTDKEP